MARGFDDTRLSGMWQEATGEGEDGLKKVMDAAVQRVSKEELTTYLQAESAERTEARKGYWSGYKPRIFPRECLQQVQENLLKYQDGAREGSRTPMVCTTGS